MMKPLFIHIDYYNLIKNPITKGNKIKLKSLMVSLCSISKHNYYIIFILYNVHCTFTIIIITNNVCGAWLVFIPCFHFLLSPMSNIDWVHSQVFVHQIHCYHNLERLWLLQSQSHTFEMGRNLDEVTNNQIIQLSNSYTITQSYILNTNKHFKCVFVVDKRR